MLKECDTVATVAVRDLQQAARFYEQTLGLEAINHEGDQVITYRTGATRLNVYHSDFAGSNRATAVTWPVGARLEQLVQSLRDKGVQFERYDLPGMQREGDIHICGALRVAWFKDLDGNIFNLVNA